MKPTVAHLLPNYNPFPPRYAAGTELRVEQVALRQQRYRPVVICGWFPGELEMETLGQMNVRRIRIGRVYRRIFQKITRWDPYPYTERMWRHIQREQASLIHIHNEPKLLAGLSRHLAADSRPVIVHVANEKPLMRFELSRVDRWIACSRYIADWLVSQNGIPSEKVSVIYTGVDVQARPSIAEIPVSARREVRQRFGINDPDGWVVLFAGRLVKEKGVSELLDAFEVLRARYGDRIQLLIAGNVRDSDDPNNEKANYGRAMVNRIANMHGVRWVGSLAPEKMHEFLLAGDVFAMPSLWPDPFPTVMLEAAAAGLPIVSAGRGGITEFLEDMPGFEAHLQLESPTALADGIRKFLEDHSLRLVAGARLREKVEKQFAWTRVRDDFENCYDALIDSRVSR